MTCERGLTIDSITKLTLNPDEVLVFKVQTKLTPEIRRQIRETLDNVLPDDIPIIVLGEDIELQVINSKDVEA